jgi:hypothetical protein
MVRNDLRAAVDATEINSASNMASGDPRDRT